MTNWNTARNLIIGGNGLLSKRPERYSPQKWPNFYKRALGSKVLATNNNWYYDFSEFSIGCNPFGYAPNHLRWLPIKYIFSSPLSTLNSQYEILLAEELNKTLEEKRVWKFTRGGGESMALAARFGRAISKENGPILVTGYHGWHDWYLAANINSNNLDELLIPGLEPYGVPEDLKATIKACTLEDLEKSINSYKPSIIVYEGSRSEILSKESIRILKVFQQNGGVLMADEITSGFRTKELSFSKLYGLIPDILILGKALGSGYAISAIGCLKNNTQENLKNVFASSTFWTEEIGLRAGYLTLKYFYNKREEIDKKLRDNTFKIREIIYEACEIENFSLKINKHPTLIYSTISYKDFDKNLIKSLLCAKMLDKRILFSNNIYPCLAHNNKSFSIFKKGLINSLNETKKLLESKNIKDLENNFGIVNNGFTRLTK